MLDVLPFRPLGLAWTPAATPDAATAVAPSTPAPDTGKTLSGQIPWQIAPHAANGEFAYPFLGSVKAYVQSQVLRLHTRSGAVAEFPVKVFYTEQGNFIRAEFVQPNAPDFQSPVEDVAAASKQSSQAVTGLLGKTPPVSLESAHSTT